MADRPNAKNPLAKRAIRQASEPAAIATKANASTS
jgi:hypothetical protein